MPKTRFLRTLWDWDIVWPSMRRHFLSTLGTTYRTVKIEGIFYHMQERRMTVGPATVNRELATLRRLLRLAHEWKEINRVPKIRLLAGERIRDFVLSRRLEEAYLAACAQPLADIALLVLEAGLRIGEVLSLLWTDVVLDP